MSSIHKKEMIQNLLIVALSLGTAWAVRGKFGHEQGAAWAGAIGALAVILAAGRKDWYHNAFKAALAAAVGWGAGGVISYGVVVGYGRADDFGNAYYGLAMLFVIGALYGFLGGGLFGLALADRAEKRIPWWSLMAEMVALSLLVYGFLINQLEWLMTPPRSEMWAACLGAALSLLWFLLRSKQSAALRVAVFSALGAGFGFGFGNFLQVLGTGTSFPVNLWNVMEYSIGFFGGLGMAYGTFTASWPEVDRPSQRSANFLPLLILVVFVPFVVWDQSFVKDRFEFLLTQGGTQSTVFSFQAVALSLILLFAVMTFIYAYKSKYDSSTLRNWFFGYLGVYTILSFELTGYYIHPVEQYLYLVNMAVVAVLMRRLKPSFEVRENAPRKWLMALGMVLALLALLALVAVSTHGTLKGSQIRF